MKGWTKRLVLLALLAAVGYWGWTLFYQSPETAIRKQLRALAHEVSFGTKQGVISQAWRATAFSSFFTTNVELTIDAPGTQHHIAGLDELTTAVLGARQMLRSLQIELPDINIAMQPGGEAAVVNVTARGAALYPNGVKEDYLQELRLYLIKVKRDWLIKEIATVRTLSSLDQGTKGPKDQGVGLLVP
jgi:hypothetical protein